MCATRYRTKVIVAGKLEPLVTGGVILNRRLRGLWGFGESEHGMCCFTGPGHYPLPVPRESRGLAIRTSHLVCDLFARKENSRWLIDFDEEKDELVCSKTKLVTGKPAAEQRGQRAIPKEVGTSYDFQLTEGFTFSIWNPAGMISIAHVLAFLGESLNYFKYQRAHWGAGNDLGCASFSEPIALGTRPIGWMGIWFCSNRPFDFDIEDLCQRVAKLYSIATTLEELAKCLRTNPAATGSSGLEDVFDSLKDDDKGLEAFQIFFDRKWEW